MRVSARKRRSPAFSEKPGVAKHAFRCGTAYLLAVSAANTANK